jgi:hypothetical protein
MGLDRDFIAEGEVSDGVLSPVPVSLTLLRAVDAVESDFFDPALLHDSDGITVNDTNDGPGEVFCERGTGEKDMQHYDPDDRQPLMLVGLSRRGEWNVHGGSVGLQHREPGGSFILLLSPYLRRDDLSRS